jgi:hypothetical protein
MGRAPPASGVTWTGDAAAVAMSTVGDWAIRGARRTKSPTLAARRPSRRRRSPNRTSPELERLGRPGPPGRDIQTVARADRRVRAIQNLMKGARRQSHRKLEILNLTHRATVVWGTRRVCTEKAFLTPLRPVVGQRACPPATPVFSGTALWSAPSTIAISLASRVAIDDAPVG